MIRIFVFTLACVFTSFVGRSQIGTGEWRMHVAASKAIDVAVGNGTVITALTTGVLYYSIDANEYKVYNNTNGLSDIKVSCVVYHSGSNSFIVGYQNGNIDQILSNGAVINIPGVLLANILGSKRINELEPYNGVIYASTGFGVVVIDPYKHEIKDTYYPGSSASPILDAAVKTDTLFALIENGCYKAPLSNNFLADPSQWVLDSRMPNPVGGSYAKLGVQQNELHVLYKKDGYGGDSIMRITNSGMQQQIGNSFEMEILDFDVVNDYFMVVFDVAIILYDENDGVYKQIQNYNTNQAAPKAVAEVDGVCWVADNNYGLVRYIDQYMYTMIDREGPPKDQFFSLNSYKDKVIVTAGILDRTAFAYNRGGVYTFQDESWKLYDQNNQPVWSPGNVWDMSSAAINPLNEDEMAVGSYSYDALSLINASGVTNSYSASNSIIENTSLGNNNACISAVEYDEFGNLWMCNCYSNAPLKVRTADGTWQSLPTGTDTKSKFTTKLSIDYNNNKWFGVYGVGLVGYNDNETPTVLTDDSYKILRTGVGSGNLPSDVVTALAVDFDNEIWIGTEAGFVVLYNSDGIFGSSSSYDASRILVTYEGNVEELLGDTPITDIEIDGGNRKWIATASTGIFLLSADGQEVIAQYNKDNSPLISNNIMDMDFNHTTGELFIVTDLGLVSMRTDASYEDENYSTTTVFPNPVRPEYTGTITIQGIRYNSDVKVTDIAGNLVYQTTSNGGTATWNGKTLTGENVASGVYLFWTATNEGKDEKVGKVVVIR